MRLIYFVPYIIYEFYKYRGGAEYFMTLASLAGLALIQAFIVFTILDIYAVLPFLSIFDRFRSRGTLMLALVPFYLLSWLFIRRERLAKMHVEYANNWDLIYKGRVLVVVYSVFCVVLASILIIYRTHYQAR